MKNYIEPALIVENTKEVKKLVKMFERSFLTDFNHVGKEIIVVSENVEEKVKILKTLKKFLESKNITSSIKESEQKDRFSRLLESDLDQASIVLAGKELLSDLQTIAEQIAKMRAKNLLPIIDEMKLSFGSEQSDRFSSVAENAFDGVFNSIVQAKDSLGTELATLQRYINGDTSMDDDKGEDDTLPEPAAEEPKEEPELDSGGEDKEENKDVEDELFGSGSEEERTKKESVDPMIAKIRSIKNQIISEKSNKFTDYKFMEMASNWFKSEKSKLFKFSKTGLIETINEQNLLIKEIEDLLRIVKESKVDNKEIYDLSMLLKYVKNYKITETQKKSLHKVIYEKSEILDKKINLKIESYKSKIEEDINNLNKFLKIYEQVKLYPNKKSICFKNIQEQQSSLIETVEKLNLLKSFNKNMINYKLVETINTKIDKNYKPILDITELNEFFDIDVDLTEDAVTAITTLLKKGGPAAQNYVKSLKQKQDPTISTDPLFKQLGDLYKKNPKVLDDLSKTLKLA